MKNLDYILKNFRLVNGKLERLHEGEWIDTSEYADQKRIRVEGNMVKREKIVQALSENEVAQEEIEPWSAKAQARLQKQQDSNRIERALFRKEARKLNESNELFEELLERVGASPTPVISPITRTGGGTLIIGFSDTHLGEVVSLPGNVVNTRVINKRLNKFVEAAVKAGIAFGCRRAIIALTGDVAANSDRRVDSELMSNEFSRSHALLNAFEIVSQAINQVTYHVPVTSIVSVLGNEPRVREHLALEPRSFMDNFDFILHEMLRAYFPAVNVSKFGNPVERIIEVDGVSILLTHGITKSKSTPEAQLSYYRAKHGKVDYMISGHLHSSLVAAGFSRSGSPIGNNCYSEYLLGIANGIPSQSYHIVTEGRVISVPVDLTEGSCNGYILTPVPTQSELIKTREVI